MKKNKLTLTIVFTLMMLIAYACKKENTNLKSSNEIDKSNINIPRKSGTSRTLNDSVINLIGIKHNQVMENLLLQVGMDSSNIRHKFDSLAVIYPDSYIDSALTNRMEAMDSVVNYTDEYLSVNLNTSVHTMMQEIKSYLLTQPNFGVLQNELNSYRVYANTNFTGDNLDISLVFIEVIEKSSYFWMPISQGGSGLGKGYIDNFNDYNDMTYAPINWGQIAYSDGAGAAGTLLRTWYLAGGGPLTWSVIIGAVGFGAAWSSGAAILYQLMA